MQNALRRVNFLVILTFSLLPCYAQTFAANQLLHHSAMETVGLRIRTGKIQYYQSISASRLYSTKQPYHLFLYATDGDTIVLRWEQIRSDQLPPLVCIQPLDRRASHDTLKLWYNHSASLPLEKFIAEFNRAVIREILLPLDHFPPCFDQQQQGMRILRVTKSGIVHCYANIEKIRIERVEQSSRKE